MSQEHAWSRRVTQWWLMHRRQGLTVNIISDVLDVVYSCTDLHSLTRSVTIFS